MPRTITTIVYTYQELLDLGKMPAIQKAREWLREAITSCDWWESTVDTWRAALNQIGFNRDPNIAFSGFWSQGDGASFTSNIELALLARFLSTPIVPENRIGVSEGSNGVEDFRPWIAYKVGGVLTHAKYRRLTGLDNFLGEHSVTRTNPHYSHENTCSVNLCIGDFRRAHKVDMLMARFEKSVEDLRLGLCKAIYHDLEDEYEYLIGEESMLDFAEADGYTFTENGRRAG